MNKTMIESLRTQQKTIFVKPDKLQIDCFYLDLLGLDLDDILKLLNKSTIEGVEHISTDDISMMINAETILYAVASMQTPMQIDPDEIEIPF